MKAIKLSAAGKRALVVDDEPSLREALCTLFEFMGMEVVDAADGREALQLYRRGVFDFVFTDYSMPKMRGDELARKIRNINPQQTIVMISAFCDEILQNGRRLSCINRLIPKPCSLGLLAGALTDKSHAARQPHA